MVMRNHPSNARTTWTKALKCGLKRQHMHEEGFTFLGLLLAIMLLSVGLTSASEVWFTTAQRQRQVQTQWAAQEFVRAIGSYYESGPGGVKRFPRSVGDLLEDRRGGTLRRHLRQNYANPQTSNREWTWVTAPDGGLMGVQVLNWNASTESQQHRDFVYLPSKP